MEEAEEAVLDLHDLEPSNALVAVVAWLTYLHYIGKSNNWSNPWGDNRRFNAVIVTGEGPHLIHIISSAKLHQSNES